MIRTLEQRGLAYVAGGNVYFDVRAFPGYGAMANLDLDRVETRARVEADSENKELESDFWKYTYTNANSDRVGEFAIGTNIELKEVIGHILQDEKFPGIHIAFGDPYGAHTGADW